MYCVKHITADAMMSAATEMPPLGPGFSSEEAAQADTLEMWGTSFSDPGDDFVEYRLLKEGQIVHTKRFAGY